MKTAEQNYNDLENILTKSELFFEKQEDYSLIIPFRGEDFSTDIAIHVDEDFYILECLLPTIIPFERRPEIALYLTFLNDRVKMGRFSFDMSSGEVAFNTTGMFEIIESHVQKLIGLTLNMAKQQIKPVYAIAFGEKEPLDVYNDFFDETSAEETVEN